MDLRPGGIRLRPAACATHAFISACQNWRPDPSGLHCTSSKGWCHNTTLIARALYSGTYVGLARERSTSRDRGQKRRATVEFALLPRRPYMVICLYTYIRLDLFLASPTYVLSTEHVDAPGTTLSWHT